MWPAQGDITQGFKATHEGLDIAGPSGTPIVAAASVKLPLQVGVMMD
jgi:lysostaphin